MAVVTFVIPTIGRDTLSRALDSLLAQTDEDWEAVVVYDGVPRGDFPKKDKRIWYIETQNGGTAGQTRNVGINWHSANGNSEWIGFLDDDDVLGSTYVEHLREHIRDYPLTQVVVFRMDHPGYGIIPASDGVLAYTRVGISFAMRSDLGYRFVAEDVSRAYHEDWELISRMMSEKKNIFVSPYTEYIVRNHTHA